MHTSPMPVAYWYPSSKDASTKLPDMTLSEAVIARKLVLGSGWTFRVPVTNMYSRVRFCALALGES